MNLSQEFIEFALSAEVLRFGEFKTKAGRISPYFFNAGLFNRGSILMNLAQFYAKTLLGSNISFDMLFGPAYKGITLAAATSIELARLGHDVPFAYNRKEAKDHGEGGNLVGATLQGNVVIIDDVISAGTSVRESVDMIKNAGANPCAVLIALDRMEKSGTADNIGEYSAVQQVQKDYNIPVIAIASLNDLFDLLQSEPDHPAQHHYEAIAAYRNLYGSINA